MTQPDLFGWSPPVEAAPSPTPERFKRPKNEPRDYAAEWRTFVEERPGVWDSILAHARNEAAIGAQRISVNLLFEDARRRFTLTINNSWRAACADDLAAADPRLSALIERRRRKTTR